MEETKKGLILALDVFHKTVGWLIGILGMLYIGSYLGLIPVSIGYPYVILYTVLVLLGVATVVMPSATYGALMVYASLWFGARTGEWDAVLICVIGGLLNGAMHVYLRKIAQPAPIRVVEVAPVVVKSNPTAFSGPGGQVVEVAGVELDYRDLPPEHEPADPEHERVPY